MTKVFLTQAQLDWMQSLCPELATSLRDQIVVVKSIDSSVNVGEINSSEQYRVAPYPEVPGLRGLGHRFDQVYIDETHNWTETNTEWEHGDDAPKWMEHGMFRPRDVPPCVPRDSWGKPVRKSPGV